MITKRQREVLDFIDSFIGRNGFCPSYREIGDAFSLSSLSTVHKHIVNLQIKGLLRRNAGRSRSLGLISEPEERFIYKDNDRLWDTVLHCY